MTTTIEPQTSTQRLTQSEQEELLPHPSLARYGTDEYVQLAGKVPRRMTFIVNGHVHRSRPYPRGGDFLGSTTLTREPVGTTAYALDEVTVLQIEREHIEELVTRKPVLLQDIGRAIEERRASLRRTLAAKDD
jgi:CRP-like cAMP-binding protein